MAVAAANLSPDNVRRADRAKRNVSATVRAGSPGAYDATVRNLSVSGCLVDVAIDLVEGDGVSIGINGLGVLRARVVRREGGAYGLSFFSPLSDADLAEIGRSDTVVSLIPDADPAQESTMPEPDRWSRRRRLIVISVVTALCWIVLAGGLSHLLS